LTFLNATLIFGALAAGVPIVLHLIARKEPRREIFPAVRFLTQRFETNRTRLKVKRWWLLLLRVLALVALAVALARPTIHQDVSTRWLMLGLLVASGVALLVLATIAVFRDLGRSTAIGLALAGATILVAALGWGGYSLASQTTPTIEVTTPVAVALVVDNGPSSAWVTDDRQRLTEMQDHMQWIIGQLPETSRIAVVDRSSQAIAFSVDARAAMARAGQIKVRQAAVPLAPRIESAARLLRTSDLPDRMVVVISDLDQSTWQPSPPRPLVSQSDVSITVLDVGDFDRRNRQLRVPNIDTTPPRLQPQTILAGVRVTEAADPASDPNRATSSVTAELKLYEIDASKPVMRDGELVLPDLKTVDRKVIDATPGRDTDFSMTLPPLPEGLHHGQLRLVGNDAMPLDDVRYLTWSVGPPTPLLIVAGDRDQSDLIAWAATSPLDPDDPEAAFDVDRVAFADLAAVRVEDYPAIVLLDPTARVLQQDSLKRYVDGGGNVVVALGPALDRSAVSGTGPVANRAATDLGSLPRPKRVWKVPDEGSFLQVVRGGHPIFAGFQGLTTQPRWSDFRVRLYWQLETSPEDRVLARFAGTDHPALLVRPSGEGRWLILATPLAAGDAGPGRWNDLFGTDAWPTFILVRQMIEVMAGPPSQQRVITVGNAQRLPIPTGDQNLADRGTDPATRWQLFGPASISPQPIEVAAGAENLVINNVDEAGTYWLRSPTASTGFSANLPGEVVGGTKIRADDLVAWFGEAAEDAPRPTFRLVRDREAIEFVGGDSPVTVPLRSPAMLLALAVFLLEQILGNRFYRSGGSATGPAVAGAGATPGGRASA